MVRIAEKLKIKRDGKIITVQKKQRLHYRKFPNSNSDGVTAQIFFIMKDKRWYDLITLASQTTKPNKIVDIGMHIRRLKTPYFGGHTIEKKFIAMDGTSHVYKYRLTPNPKWKK